MPFPHLKQQQPLAEKDITFQCKMKHFFPLSPLPPSTRENGMGQGRKYVCKRHHTPLASVYFTLQFCHFQLWFIFQWTIAAIFQGFTCAHTKSTWSSLCSECGCFLNTIPRFFCKHSIKPNELAPINENCVSI